MSDELMRSRVELNAINPEVWSSLWYPTLLENLVWVDSIAMDYQGDMNGRGDTVHITNFPQFGDAVDLAEGSRVDAQALTPTGQSLVVNHEIAQDFSVTQKAIIQTIEAQDKLREHAFFSILKKIDQIVYADVAPSAAAPDHITSYASGTTLALADLLDAQEALNTQNVPDNGQRVGVIGVAQNSDLFNIAGFVSRDFVPNANALSSGAITTPVMGFKIKFTTMVGTVSTFFDPIFMQMAVQRNAVPQVYDQGVIGQRSFRTNLTVLFGNKQCSNLRVYQKA